MGYREINLNLGCPMPTVVKKGRGSGQLGDLDALDRFLEEVCRGLEKELRFTVKTRIGLESADSAAKLLEIYNRYPIAELTVHPRTQRDLYGGTPDLETFSMFLEKSVHPVVYNGDIFSVSDYERICARFPGCSAFMLGRGLIANPALARELCCGAPLQKEELRQFHDAVYKELKETLPGQAVLIGKMKELWFYMGRNFADADRFLKEIRKAKNEIQYRSAVRVLFANCPFPASGHTEANVGE
jgi:tRNA-dihydrouridine synthase